MAFHRICYRQQNTLQILVHLIIPKTQDTPAIRLQPCVTAFVMLAVRMLAAIKFHYQFERDTSEVCNIAPNRMLPPESRPAQLAASEGQPELRLNLCRLAAQGAGEGYRLVPEIRHNSSPLTPTLSRKRERE